MPLNNTDLFIVERSGVQYNMSADQIADFVGAVRDFTAASISARDALSTAKVGDRVFVVDASADATVDSGWAVYRVSQTAPLTFDKIQEQEGMDTMSVGVTDLAYNASATQGVITSSTGQDATIPAVTGTTAGLATPQMLVNSHVPATTSGTTASNPVNIDPSQVVSFNITQLDPLP